MEMRTLIGLLGRWCLSIIFIISGVSKIFDWQGVEHSLVNAMCETASYYYNNERIREILEYIIPQASILLVVAVAFEIIGGVLIFIGVQVRLGAFLLILFIIPTTFFFHHFWQLQGGDRDLQLVMFMKNLSIFGGLLLLLAYGKGHKNPKPTKLKEKKEESA